MLEGRSVPVFLRSLMAIPAFATSCTSVRSLRVLILVMNLLLMRICLDCASLHDKSLVSDAGIPDFVALAYDMCPLD